MPIHLVVQCVTVAFWVAATLHEPAPIWKWGWGVMALKALLSILWALFMIGVRCVEWLLEVFWYNYDFQLLRSMHLGSYTQLFMMMPNYALLVFLPTAVISDFRQHRRLHWSHWLVVGTTFVSAAAMAVTVHIVL